MMIIPDKKKMATMIVAQMHGPKEEAAEGEDGDVYQELAGEVLKAVKAGSASELADALKAFHEQCEANEDSDDYGDEGE